MRQFSLPAELLKFSVFNFVDLDSYGTVTKSSNDNSAVLDKELLMSIEEIEKKFNISSDTSVQTVQSTSIPTIPANTNPSAKFIRPDVTWLRRTEYISSVKNNPNGTFSPNLSVDEAKDILNEAVKFDEIVEKVNETFMLENGSHPHKKNLELVQSFPINLTSPVDFVNFLILGDNNQANENSILQIREKSSTTTPTISLFNPTNQENTYKSAGDFDIQKSESVKSFVLMLPTSKNTNNAVMSKISSNFSLRKRRAVAKGNEKIKKAKNIKVHRT